MKIGTITRDYKITYYFIALGILAWFVVTRNVLFNGGWLDILFMMIPLIPIVGLPSYFQSSKIEIYEDYIVYQEGFKKTKYSLLGVDKVYRKNVKTHFSGDGVERFQYIALQFDGGFTLSFPFSFVSQAKDTPLLLNRIEKMNPSVEFDKEMLLIKNGMEHPMNKWFRRITLGLGSGIYIAVILMNLG